MPNSHLKIAVPAPVGKTGNYFAALAALGAEPVFAGADCAAGDFDGLLLPGGGDIAPRRYGEEMNGSQPPDEELDAWQFAVLRKFLAAGKPVLGICRGHQLINVYFGGTLCQDLPEAASHRQLAGVDQAHPVDAVPGSFLGALYGERFPVNSAHHQGCAEPGRGIAFTAFSDTGVVEALAHETLPVWGLQFHPERMCFAHRRPDTVDGSAVLKFFLEQCR